MEENQKSSDGILEKLAIITDATQQMFPEGKSLIMFELNIDDFKKVQSHFRKIDQNHTKFVVDISGVEVVFITENSMDKITDEKPKTFWGKLRNSFFRKSSEGSIKN